jgi:hypothetical protein
MYKHSSIFKVVEEMQPPAASIVLHVGRLPKAHIPTRLETILFSKDSLTKVISRVKSVLMPHVFSS